jgi:hypothetical protein
MAAADWAHFGDRNRMGGHIHAARRRAAARPSPASSQRRLPPTQARKGQDFFARLGATRGGSSGCFG